MNWFIWSVLLISMVVSLTVLLPSGCAHEADLDPYDMLNFDNVNMKMKGSKGQQVEKTPNLDSGGQEEGESSSHEEEKTEESLPTADEASDETVTEPTSGSGAGDAACVDACPACQPEACPALHLFQNLVARLLHLLGDQSSQVDGSSPTEFSLRLQISPRQLKLLEDFKKDSSKDKVFSAHEVLTEAMQGVRVIHSDAFGTWTTRMEERFGVGLCEVFQVLGFFMLVLILALLLPKFRLSWNLLAWILFIALLLSVATTWYRLYKGEMAKRHEAMMKELPRGCGKLPENAGTVENLYNLYKSYFTFQKDECIDYYEHLFVDPIVKISVMEAAAVAVVQTILKPLRTVGLETSEFVRALVKDLPVQWQLFTVLGVFFLVVLMLFVSCGYRLRVPFLLAIEPARVHPPAVTAKADALQRDDVECLRRQLNELRLSVEGIGATETASQNLALQQGVSADTASVKGTPSSRTADVTQALNPNLSSDMASVTNAVKEAPSSRTAGVTQALNPSLSSEHADLTPVLKEVSGPNTVENTQGLKVNPSLTDDVSQDVS